MWTIRLRIEDAGTAREMLIATLLGASEEVIVSGLNPNLTLVGAETSRKNRAGEIDKRLVYVVGRNGRDDPVQVGCCHA